MRRAGCETNTASFEREEMSSQVGLDDHAQTEKGNKTYEAVAMAGYPHMRLDRDKTARLSAVIKYIFTPEAAKRKTTTKRTLGHLLWENRGSCGSISR